MAHAKINLRARSLGLADDDKTWELRLELLHPDADTPDLVMRGEEADLPQLRKQLGKTVAARLVIGEEETKSALPADVEKLQAYVRNLEAERDRRGERAVEVDRELVATREKEHQAREQVARLEKELDERGRVVAQLSEQLRTKGDRISALDAALVATAPAGPPYDPNHELAKCARGPLTVIEEQARKWMAVAKGSDVGKWSDVVGTATRGLTKLRELTTPAKGNGKAAAANDSPAGTA